MAIRKTRKKAQKDSFNSALVGLEYASEPVDEKFDDDGAPGHPA
jgi:hypothetical protein